MTARVAVSRARAAATTLALVLVAAGDAGAQLAGTLGLPVSDMDAPRQSAAMIRTDLLDPRKGGRLSYAFQDSTGMAADPQAAVSIGSTIEALSRGVGGCTLATGIEGAVFARFRLATHSKDELSDDWWVAWPTALTCGRMRVRVRYRHHSAHLGDDVVEHAAPTSYDWSHEYADGLALLDVGAGVRVFAGGGRALRTRIPGDRWETTGGVEGARSVPGLPRVRVVAGAQLDWATRSDMRLRRSLAAGLDLDFPRAMPLRLLLRGFSGGSTVGQLSGGAERGWGVELGIRP